MKSASLIQEALRQYPKYSKKELYAMICCGEIYAEGCRLRNPQSKIKSGTKLEIRQKSYVSRGGEKLAYALEKWQIDVQDLCFIDAGASSGGFTDCLLQRGASFVHAVDVGYNQLDYKLRQDNRVHVMERCNVLALENLDPGVDAAVADISFRSIVKPAHHILSLCKSAWMIALIKPQFEWKDPSPEFNGIITEDSVLLDILLKLIEALSEQKIQLCRMLPSPILGRKGNREFLFLLQLANRENQMIQPGKSEIKELIGLSRSIL